MAESIHMITTSDAPRAIGPYSQGLKVRAPDLVFVSGQLGIDPATGEFAGQTVAEQTRRCLENLMAILGAGARRFTVVKTTVYLADMGMFAEMNEVYKTFFSEPYPARACVAVRELPKGALVEIEAIAVVEG